MKYTKEILTPAVLSSYSVNEVIRKINGGSVSGVGHRWVSKKIRDFGIDTSHFLGYRHNLGKISNRKKGPDKRLVIGKIIRSYILRRCLLEIGRKYLCETCTNSGTWMNKQLGLEIDHKNANRTDNRPENLRFMCPNCHSQTETFGNKTQA